jgi:hypothetical protein
MASTYSPSLKLQLIGSGDQSGVWGTTTNTNLGTLLEQAITGVQSIVMSNADYTLTSYNGASDEARNAVLSVTGTNAAVRKIVAPLVNKLYTVFNNTTGGYAITIGAASGSIVTIPNGSTVLVYCDGTNFYSGLTGSTGNFKVPGDLTVTGNEAITGNSTITGNLTVGGTITGSGLGGRVAQAITSQYTTTVSTSSSSFVTTGHTATITPTSSTSKILVLQSGTMAQPDTGTASANSMLTIYRNSTNLAGSNGIMGNVNIGYTGSIYASIAVSLLDAPATTSATTYTVYYKNTASGQTVYNYGFGAQLANLTLLEITA